ncbi:SPRY domain-containing SOCS box protein 3 isoform X2 [Coccinella septempunctata]|nr:SPRY domain-containing SOCS box protein 3 isoform X2 [Coccinella septempunctata]
MHYYWELKMISKLYGTDVMIGVGTKEGLQNFTNYRFRFCSMLGLDDQTWGYSYHGKIQHDKLTRIYGESFGLSSRIGVHLDMCSGKLEYYINRKPLGVAFTGLKKKELYPMACATAAQSSMRLICSVSQEETLQMLCLKCVHQNSYLYEKYSSIPGLYKLYSQKYFWMTPSIACKKVSKEQEEEELYYLAMNNNSAKRKQKKNFLVTPRSNKKSSSKHARSSREGNFSARSNRPLPLKMDFEFVQDSSVLRFLSHGTLNHSEDSDSD